MSPYYLPAAVTFASVMALTLVVRSVATRLGMVDFPDGKRKLHDRPVSRGGGVGIYLAFALGMLAAAVGLSSRGVALSGPYNHLALALAISAGITCLVGAIDDFCCLGSKAKLALQTCAVMPILAFGYWIHRIVVFGIPIELSWFGLPLTVLWLVGCINALNLLDGMDGLASTTGLLTAIMLCIVASLLGHPHVAIIAVLLSAALAGFLVFNLPPATIFLGDSGSMVIGLVLGVLGMQSAMKTPTTLAITVPAVLLSLPMLDTALAIVRRRLTGRGIASADREHVHHRLLDRGLSQWQALCVLGSFCLATGAAATAATMLRSDLLAWIAMAMLLVAAVRLRIFGHHELQLFRRWTADRLGRLSIRLAAPAGADPFGAARAFEGGTLDEAWSTLIDELQHWNIGRVELTLSHDSGAMQRWSWTANENLRAGGDWDASLTGGGAAGVRYDLKAALHGAGHATSASFMLLSAFAEYLANLPQPTSLATGMRGPAVEVPQTRAA